MPYDGDSGLVYQEQVRRRCDCVSRALYPPLVIKSQTCHRPGHGADRLYNMAENSLLQNLHKLDVNSLSGLEAQFLERIWRVIVRCGRDHLPVWKTFVRAKAGILNNSSRQWTYECSRCCMVPQIVSVVHSPDAAWLTDVHLGAENLEPADLANLARLSNIRQLEVLSRKTCNVTDRVLRSWALAAEEDDSFSRLEKLTVQTCTSSICDDLSAPSLQLLNAFPRLVEVVIQTTNGNMVVETKRTKHYGAFSVDSEDNPSGCLTSHTPILLVQIGRTRSSPPNVHYRRICLNRTSASVPRKRKINAPDPPSDRGPKFRASRSKALVDILDAL